MSVVEAGLLDQPRVGDADVPAPRDSGRRVPGGVPGAIVVLVLRAWRLGCNGLTYDESFSAMAARLPATLVVLLPVSVIVVRGRVSALLALVVLAWPVAAKFSLRPVHSGPAKHAGIFGATDAFNNRTLPTEPDPRRVGGLPLTASRCRTSVRSRPSTGTMAAGGGLVEQLDPDPRSA